MAMATTTTADTQNNLLLALDAAKNMEWDPVYGENRAFLLIKRETIQAEVGLIFGYPQTADISCQCPNFALKPIKPQEISGFSS